MVACTATALSPSLHNALLSSLQVRSTDTGDKRLEECRAGPTFTRIVHLFWCFETLLHSDTAWRAAGTKFLLFPKHQCDQSKLTFALD